MPAAQLRLAQSLLRHALGVSRQLDAEQPNLNIARDSGNARSSVDLTLQAVGPTPAWVR